MPDRVTIVTGGNRGIGLEVVRQLAARGARVLLAARRGEEGRRAAATLAGAGLDVRPARLDVSDAASIAAFAREVRSAGVEVEALVNNAAVYLREPGGEAARTTMIVNVLGPMRLTDALLPALARGARVVMVSSGMGQLAGLPPSLRRHVETATDRAGVERAADAIGEELGRGGTDRQLAYSVSKALLNALVRALAPELEARGVLVNAVCPGWVRTEMGGAGAPRSVEEGAAGIVWAATLPEGGPRGGLFRDGAPVAW